MKKRFCNIGVACVAVVSLIISMSHNAYAVESETKNGYIEAEQYLLQKGCPTEVIEQFDKAEMMHLVDNLKKGEASLTWTYCEIDNLEIIQYIVNSSDEELKQDGFSDEEVDVYRERIEKLKNKSDAELIDELGIDESAVKSIRKAFEVNKEFERKTIEGNNKATLSGTLTSSQFYHSLYADRYSDSVYARKYRIRAGFNWLVAFSELLGIDDEIAIGWGGGFAYEKTGITAYGDYYYALNRGLPSYGSCQNRHDAFLEEGIANAGVVFSLPQGNIIGGGLNPPKERLKTGYISFFIYKLTAENQLANVTSKYLHKAIQISSLSISTGGIIVEANIGRSMTSDCNVIMIKY